MTWNRSAEGLRGPAPRKVIKRLGPERSLPQGIGQTLGVQAQEVVDTLCVALVSGCGLMFGSTSDGGAVVVSLFVGDVVHKGYASTKEEFSALLADARDQCEARMVSGPARAVNGSRIGS